MSNPKIAIDGLSLGIPPQGLGAYAMNLVKALAEDPGEMEYLFFVPDGGVPYVRHLEGPSVIIVPCRLPGGRPGRIAYHHLMLPRRMKKAGAHLIHGTANLLPRGFHGPSLVTVHDLDFLDNPEHSPPARRWLYRNMTPRTLKKARMIVTDSEYSAAAIRQHFSNIPAEKIRVIPLGAPALPRVSEEEKVAVTAKYRLEEGYFLSVGTLERRKNLPHILEAFYLYRQEYTRPAKLVLAGQPGYGYKEVLHAVDTSAYRDSIVLPGYIPVENLPALYAGASSLIILSEAEGFGLPALEAMACDCPVIAAEAGALPEVCGEGARFVEPGNIIETADAMATLIADEEMRADQVEKGRRNLERFSWSGYARKMKEIYRELVEGLSPFPKS